MSYFKIEKSRDQKVALRLSEGTKGIKVTDRFPDYTIIDTNERQLCWAQLKRDFVKLERARYESGKSSGEALQEKIYELF
jgi:transposase